MPCYSPVTAWRCPRRGVLFRPTPSVPDIQLPCGRCIGCRLERSRQWATRMVHELRFHEQSAYITLTYSSEHLPPGGSLRPKDFQDFMKRLRKHTPQKLRFFHCGEYGEKAGRPHYHAILYGEDFREGAYGHYQNDRGDWLWHSPKLDRIWGKGLADVGSVSFESAAYVARYVTKKITGAAAKEFYTYIDPQGEIHDLHPEYATMSRRPGIGKLHFDKYAHEIYPRDEVVTRGKVCKPPKFYDRLLEKTDPRGYELLKDTRECALTTSPSREHSSPRRLADRLAVKRAQIQSLRRRFESET